MMTACKPLPNGRWSIDWDRPATVYSAFDSAGRLLYVGLAADVARRMEQHKRESEWYARCARIATVDYPTRREAAVAEDDAICAGDPEFNLYRRKDHCQDCRDHRQRWIERRRERALAWEALTTEDFTDWARAAAEALPPMGKDEIAEVARIAATIDARLSAP